MHLSSRSRRPRHRWLGTAIALLLVAMAIPFAAIRPAAAAGQMQISMQMCPDGFDGNSTVLADYQQDCTIGAGVVSFDISVDNVYWGTVDTVNNGGAQIGGVPNGLVFIQERPPQGYYGAAFCEVTAVNQPPSNYTYYGDSGFAAQLGDDDYLHCNWYLVPNGSAEPTTVTVNKHWCPDGFDAYGADLYDLAATCHESPNIDVDFELTHSSGSETKTVNGQGRIDWSNLYSGDVTIDEDAPAEYGFPRVFCKQMDLLGNDDGSEEMQVADGASIAVTIGSGKALYCDWFNIPVAYGEIYINKHWCPAGYEPQHDLTDLIQWCQEQYGDSVTFDISGANSGSGGGQGTGDIEVNAVIFDQLPVDTWTIAEQVPEGYGPPIVFCREIHLQSGLEGEYVEAPVYDGSSIVWDIQPGYRLFCDWYNVEDRPHGGVYVRKHVCPQGYDPSWEYDEWLHNCTDEPDDVEFSLSWPGGQPWKQEADGDELLAWEGVPSGNVTVKESIPQGYGRPVVYCRDASYSNGSGSYEEYDVSIDGSLKWTLEDDSYLECDWFNVPTGHGAPLPTGPATLTIVKYLCPEGYDVLDWRADPGDDCRDEQNGVTFTLSPEQGQDLSGATGDDGDGTVTFRDVDPGDYLLTEEWPLDEADDLAYAFIWGCDSNYQYAYQFTPYAMIGQQHATRIALSPGEEITCSWYNVPAEHEETPVGGDASLTIVKYDCPGSSVNPANCDSASAGVAFELLPVEEGDAIEVETGLDGTVTVEVAAGSYELIERDDEWCFASSNAFDADGYLTVEPGDAAEVEIYNCEG
ncbi:MAG: hypothetical protein IT336_12555 [Thermomicrobiales bacterium]|nr:hypothetical protein [Thermomicrobiales bacterium]